MKPRASDQPQASMQLLRATDAAVSLPVIASHVACSTHDAWHAARSLRLGVHVGVEPVPSGRSTPQDAYFEA